MQGLQDAMSDTKNNELPSFKAVYCTPIEVARCLGVTRQSVHDAIRSGRLPAPHKVGGRYYWKRTEIKSYLGL